MIILDYCNLSLQAFLNGPKYITAWNEFVCKWSYHNMQSAVNYIASSASCLASVGNYLPKVPYILHLFKI